MPETARLTKEAQDALEDIKEKYSINANTSSIIEAALIEYNEELDV